MPDIQLRPAVATDIPVLMAMDHSCSTDYIWQMDYQREAGQVGAIFREIRLPHSVKVPYPRQVSALSDSWNRRASTLIAMLDGRIAGYVRMSDLFIPSIAWITDILVSPLFRRQGVGIALILAAQSWAVDRRDTRALLEMTSKNVPMINLARKLGYEFCGYNDQYYETKDIALFFGRFLQ